MKNSTIDEYDDYSDDDDFVSDSKEHLHEDDDKLVDEEIDMNSSIN